MPPCAVVLTLLTLLVENLAQDEQPCRCLELASGSGSDCWEVTPWLEENGLPASDCSRYYDNFGGGRGCRIDHDNGDRCDGFVDEPYTPCDPDPADAVMCGRIPTCADANGDGIVDDPHDCSASPMDLDGSPHSITCALAGCTDAECCTVYAQTETAHNITAHNITAQEPDCGAAVEACAAVPECQAILMDSPRDGSCGEDFLCEVVFDATGAETGECSGGCTYVAGVTVPEWYAALLEYTEGAAFLACLTSGDPCGEEAIACVAVPECFTVLESGQGSCGDAPCEVVFDDTGAETGECSGGECIYVAGATPEAVGAALLGSTEGAALASCRATSSGHPDAQRCSAWSGDCPEGQRVMAHADDRECGTQ